MANPIDPHTHTHAHMIQYYIWGQGSNEPYKAGIGPRSQAEQTGNLAHNPFKSLQRVARAAGKGGRGVAAI